MGTSVLIPFAGDCPHRLAALAYVTARYNEEHPDWQVVVGRCDGPWVKARAVADALTRSDGDSLVVADADVWCDAVSEAAEVEAPWVVPHKAVHRLTAEATAEVLAGAPLHVGLPCDAPPYKGWLGGGIVVLPRAAYEACPLDPRFEGWGQEDESWALALEQIVGRGHRLRTPLYHLWHPPAARQSRRAGSDANLELAGRYIAARNPEAMSALVEEAR